MQTEKRLTTREYWTKENLQFEFQRHNGHAVETLLRKFIPFNREGSCIEIGSFPGPFLTVFGDLGYTLNGIDFHQKNELELPRWLQGLGYKTGEFKTTDFFEYPISRKFDVVASFGFIEHFDNYKEVILKHAALVKPGGYLALTTPNFRGEIQYWLHSTFDSNNLALHNLESMQPNLWASLLVDNGFEIKYQGHFGGFLFWRSPQQMGTLKKRSLWIIERVITRLGKLIWFQSPAFSGYCGLIASKKQTT